MRKLLKFFNCLYKKYFLREKLEEQVQIIKYMYMPSNKRITYTHTRYFKDYVFTTKEKKIIANEVIGNLEFIEEKNLLIFAENARRKKVLTIVVTVPYVKEELSPSRKAEIEERKKRHLELQKLYGTDNIQIKCR